MLTTLGASSSLKNFAFRVREDPHTLDKKATKGDCEGGRAGWEEYEGEGIGFRLQDACVAGRDRPMTLTVLVVGVLSRNFECL